MGTLIVGEFVSLDGVYQAPGGARGGHIGGVSNTAAGPPPTGTRRWVGASPR